MKQSKSEHDPLREIPSPTRRLWVGLCVILSTFVVFAVYTIREIRTLEDLQVNVVQRNRKASLQLLRLQNDAYLLAQAIQDTNRPDSRYPLRERRPEFNRLRDDMNDALRLEAQFAVDTEASREKRRQLRTTVDDFWQTADRVFTLAQSGDDGAARTLTPSNLEPRREVISEIVARLLVLNDREQAEAAEKISAVYDKVKKDILAVIAVLMLLALGTGLYTLQANRRTFEKLQHLAEQLQLQSEQLRKLSWKLIDVQEETLRRVARDLHDEFGQILTAIGAMLNRARKSLEKDSAFVEEVEGVQKIVEESLEHVRDSSQIFRPAILDDFGLDQTLEWFVGQFSRQAGIVVHFERQLADGAFPSADGIHLYRIVQEALANVARHSGAREAWVSLKQVNSELVLEVVDNGRGLEVRGEREGTGLMGMRERAEHLNGTFRLRSTPGHGTSVQVRVPLKKAAPRPAAERVS